MDLKGQWQVQEGLESLTRDLTAGQPFLGKNKRTNKKGGLWIHLTQGSVRTLRGAMLVGRRDSRESMLDFYGS